MAFSKFHNILHPLQTSVCIVVVGNNLSLDNFHGSDRNKLEIIRSLKMNYAHTLPIMSYSATIKDLVYHSISENSHTLEGRLNVKSTKNIISVLERCFSYGLFQKEKCHIFIYLSNSESSYIYEIASYRVLVDDLRFNYTGLIEYEFEIKNIEYLSKEDTVEILTPVSDTDSSIRLYNKNSDFFEK